MSQIAETSVAITIFETLALVVTYALTGFGPGFILALVLVNSLTGRNKEQVANIVTQKIRQAEKHNAQWNPAHERWQKK